MRALIPVEKDEAVRTLASNDEGTEVKTVKITAAADTQYDSLVE